MKVILTESVNKLGKIGDVIAVKDGYAKNFLIPKKKAICYSENNYRVFESKKTDYEKLNSNNLESANKVKEKVNGKNIVIIQNASDDGRLYGSVNSNVIANRINEVIAEKLVSRSEVFLKKPIKEIGVYDVKLGLHSDVEIVLKLAVSRTESEAEILFNPELKKAKAQQAKSEEGDNNQEGKKKPFRKNNFRKKKDKTSNESVSNIDIASQNSSSE
ncbi:MAG: 50S ribosomal protein L9 [Alphaproteobacteria bacterium]